MEFNAEILERLAGCAARLLVESYNVQKYEDLESIDGLAQRGVDWCISWEEFHSSSIQDLEERYLRPATTCLGQSLPCKIEFITMKDISSLKEKLPSEWISANASFGRLKLRLSIADYDKVIMHPGTINSYVFRLDVLVKPRTH